MNSLPAVLIIAYRRNQNVIELIETLILCGVSTIYVAIDGSLTSNDLTSDQTLNSQLRVFQERNPIQLKIWQRESNLGPAVSVITAIEWFFSQEDAGVILEDDLKLTSDSMMFFSEALSTFVNQNSVGLISGSNFWGEQGCQNSLPFSSYPLTWGWATWRDRWELLRKPFFCNYAFDLNSLPRLERTFWKTGIENCMDRKLDAWDIPFVANFRSLNLLAVIPHRNLVTNIGFDVYAGNTFENVWPLNTPIVGFNFAEGELGISDTNDLTKKIIQDIYHIGYRTLLARPFRLIQHLMRFRKWRSLQKTVGLVEIPSNKQ
jgi:hypothetical protein